MKAEGDAGQRDCASLKFQELSISNTDFKNHTSCIESHGRVSFFRIEFI
jgi:hypothetical protein